MSEIWVNGCGAVSPAGWGMDSFRRGLGRRDAFPLQTLQIPGWKRPIRILKVPAPQPRPGFLGHARLRRASPISHFAVAAGMEALQTDWSGLRRQPSEPGRVGVVLCVMCGCVNYSRRFYDETLKDPATASPLVFPETVFNAPASHLAAVLGVTGRIYTLVGDPAVFLQGLGLAADWLVSGSVDECLVVAAEEMDHLIVDGSMVFNRNTVVSEGAAAVCLGRQPQGKWPVCLERITDSFIYAGRSRREAAELARAQLGDWNGPELLCGSFQGNSRADRDEVTVYSRWHGPRLSVRNVFGEGFTAAAGWQCLAAIDALVPVDLGSAVVSVVGCNQQAVAARFVRMGSESISPCTGDLLA